MTASDVDHEVQCLEIWGGTHAVETTLAVPGVDVWVFSDPYRGHANGGDIHYISSCFTGRVARFALADISGHGDHASGLAETLRRLMRKHINYLDQTGLARVLNTEFAALSQESRFATALLMSYFAPSDHLVICNAGHPRPLWYQAEAATWQWLDFESPAAAAGPNNLPLGLIESTGYVQFSVRLGQGDFVLMYTDWLVEAESDDDRPLGESGLLEMMIALTAGAESSREGDPVIISARSLGERLLAAAAAHRGPRPFEDDRTLMLLHHNASPVPRRPVRGAIRAVANVLGLAGD